MGGKTPLLGNFLWPMAGEVTLCRTEPVPTTGRQVVRGSLGMEREAESLPWTTATLVWVGPGIQRWGRGC